MLPSLHRQSSPAVTSAEAEAERSPHVVMSGYFGFSNLGDEAILEVEVGMLRRAAPNCRITVLSGNPIETRKSLGVEAVDRLDLFAVWRALRCADLFLSGGGSLLQDVTGIGSVPYYLGVTELARWAGVPRVMLAQGVGPLQRAFSRRLVGQVVGTMELITVRDEASARLLASCGVPSERITTTVDPVLAMSAVPLEEQVLEDWGLKPAQPIVAVSLRPWPTWTERELKAFSAVLAQSASAWGAQVLLLPFHRPDDELLLDELAQCLAVRPEAQRPHVVCLSHSCSPTQMMGLMARVDLVIGMRLHALIMAAASATPAVAVVYDPKVKAFADIAGYPRVESVTDLGNNQRLATLLETAWQGRTSRRAALNQSLPAWRTAAFEPIEQAIGLATRGRRRVA
ncbi:MAG: polysaccharide pyruvyl transferase CsaB [Candidatus Sericytochromatia bacterium]|nr:polysaccharide pyruvyl transferase CsaB [Candidatus Sericytochromatia bacterium]